ncbi:PP2C family protein-serine/threonine phosphatase [Limnoglobus roseus]|uniref:CBS domain-containing protein n=1 Tax=Limnoglobus roseus TaxID=2598579 RepID=A0A5C1A655_9BACT|nr:SpoIIE family protein phosphatase [Limnoglobus roseus]QEL14699.1 CBS domain-containing protein [Limnoglobus roseus]
MASELTVRQVMQPEPIVVAPDCPVRDVLRVMNRNRIGAVLVVRNETKLVGIFTERDLLKRVITAIPGWRDYPVSDWMTADPYTINGDVGWDEAVGMMTKFRVRHLPVLQGGKLVGLISSRALMNRRTEVLDQRVDERTRELKLVNDELLAKDAETAFNLRAAGQMQKLFLLPHAPPHWPELDWGINYAPLDHLGGDYYDFATPDADHLGILIADASGHSIPAAMVAVMARTAFAEVAHQTIKPGEVLGAMNHRLQDLAGERFVTAFYGILNRRTRAFRYASAGHPPPLLVRGDSREVRPLAAQGFLLGVMPDEIYNEKQIEVRPGDRLCFYTDGVTEARDPIGEMFGTERLIGCLTNHGHEKSASVLDHIMACQQHFCDGYPYTDDVTLLTVGVGV